MTKRPCFDHDRLTIFEQWALEGRFVEEVTKAIDFMVTHCKDANWDAVSKAMRTLEAGFTRSQLP